MENYKRATNEYISWYNVYNSFIHVIYHYFCEKINEKINKKLWYIVVPSVYISQIKSN